MAKPFDAAPKGLVEIRPADWPAFLGVVARAVEKLVHKEKPDLLLLGKLAADSESNDVGQRVEYAT